MAAGWVREAAVAREVAAMAMATAAGAAGDWETAVKAMGGWEMEEAGWVAMGWAAGRAEATGAPA